MIHCSSFSLLTLVILLIEKVLLSNFQVIHYSFICGNLVAPTLTLEKISANEGPEWVVTNQSEAWKQNRRSFLFYTWHVAPDVAVEKFQTFLFSNRGIISPRDFSAVLKLLDKRIDSLFIFSRIPTLQWVIKR